MPPPVGCVARPGSPTRFLVRRLDRKARTTPADRATESPDHPRGQDGRVT